MMQKKSSLGRGLDARMGGGYSRPLPEAAPAAASTAPAARDGELARLPVERLQRGKYQPRTDMRTESLQELADSIRAQGVVQPIVVRPLDEHAGPDAQRYEILAGERRWRAAQLAGLTEIPAVVRRIPDDAAIAVALIENIQRENLNPLEESRALERRVSEFQLTHQQVADAVGRSRAAVSTLLRLRELPPEVCALVESRELEMGHARALLALSSRRQQAEVGALVARKGLSVRETEALVRRLQQPAKPEPDAAPADPDVRRLEQDLTEKLGARVSIKHTSSGRGRLVVDYHSLDELDGILARIQ